MKVILTQRVNALGNVGEIVNVSPVPIYLYQYIVVSLCMKVYDTNIP